MVVPIEVFSSPMAVAQERSEMTAFTIQASKNGDDHNSPDQTNGLC